MNIKKTALYLGVCICAFTIGVKAMSSGGGKDVTVKYIDRFSDEEVATTYKTQHKTVEEFIEKNNIQKGEFDKLSHTSSHNIIDGSEITISKAVPITIKYQDSVITTATSMPTVSRALAEAGLLPGEDDIISPSGSSKITEGMNISITKVESGEVTEFEYTDFKTEYADDSTLAEGKTKIKQNGKKGRIKITYAVSYNDGKQVSKKETSRITESEPVSKIIAVGTKKAEKTDTTNNTAVLSKATPKPTDTPVKTKSVSNQSEQTDTSQSKTVNGLEYTKKLEMTATAYSAFNSKGGYAKTASGMTARKGIVAVDRSVIPLGTRLYIEGYGEAVAGDVGGAIKGNKIDLCFEESNSTLRKFGRQKVQVYILD